MKKICVVLFAILLIFIENNHDITSYAMTETWEEVQGIFVDEPTYVLSRNGMGTFCSVYAYLSKDVTIDITADAEYVSSNEAVVSVHSGVIRAEGKGTAVVTVLYHGFTTSFNVTVEKEVDLDRLEKEFLQRSGVEVADNAVYQRTIRDIFSSETRTIHARSSQDILDKAVAMKNIEWTPTQTLYGWKKEFSFPKGVLVTGIPYSQANQADDLEFLKVLKYSDFYSGGESPNGDYCPKYGVDCSRYVSYAMGITAQTTATMVSNLKNGTGDIEKVGSYNVSSPNQVDLLAAYRLTDEGNGLVHRYNGENHAMLVVYNDKNAEEITVYETQIKTPFMTTYSYSTLAKKRYLPFKIK